MPSTILRAKRALLPIKRFLNYEAVYLARKYIRPKLILLYHSVRNDSDNYDTQSLSISSTSFEEQIRFLHENAHIFSPCSFSTDDKPGVLITFDDGFEDNFTVAVPILQKYNITPIIFVSPYYIAHARDKIHWSQALDWFKSLKISDNIPYSSLSRYFKNHPEASLNIQKCCQTILNSSLATTDPASLSPRRFMTPDEVAYLSINGLAEIGNHSYTHPCMSTLDPNHQLLEILLAQIQLHNMTGKYPQYFAYPFGSKDSYNSSSIEVVSKFGFKYSFTNSFGFASCLSHKFSIPRILIDTDIGFQDLQQILKLIA